MPTETVRPRSTRMRGGDAEQAAAAYLAERGLAIVARNFLARRGELDLVCEDAGILVIVEVRQRTTRRFGGALASVTHVKQRRIARATQVFLFRHPRWRACRLRFDVLAIDGDPAGAHQITWVRDAFR